MLNRQEYMTVLDNLLKDGLKQFNNKNVIAISKKDNNKKGVIAGFDSKDSMKERAGVLIRSMETLYGLGNMTHWTPNVFSWLGGGSSAPIRGHKEENLIQINTFVADIDFPEGDTKINLSQLLLFLLEEGLLPTLILDTPKGYHVYFSIQNFDDVTEKYEKASYISSANNYKSLRVAKKISENIRKAIKRRLPAVDMGCNHFGIFRFPTQNNIVHYEPNFVDTFEGYLDWSKRFEALEEKEMKSKLTVLKSSKKRTGFRQINTKWYDFLIRADIAEGDRNRAVFTLSLACKQSGLSMAECIDEMDQVQFSYDLSDKEVKRTVKSAYQGAYKGAKGTYINDLIESYTTEKQYQEYAVSGARLPRKRKGNRVDPCYWVKFAKPRELRKYSHYSESQKDLLVYLESKQKEVTGNDLYINATMQQISDETKIALSSLKVILKELKESKEVVLKTTRGRYGTTKIATTRFVTTKVLMALISRKKASVSFVIDLLGEENRTLVETIVAKYTNKAVPFYVDEHKNKEQNKDNRIRGENAG